jgi:hypothetical protein
MRKPRRCSAGAVRLETFYHVCKSLSSNTLYYNCHGLRGSSKRWIATGLSGAALRRIGAEACSARLPSRFPSSRRTRRHDSGARYLRLASAAPQSATRRLQGTGAASLIPEKENTPADDCRRGLGPSCGASACASSRACARPSIAAWQYGQRGAHQNRARDFPRRASLPQGLA